MCPDGEFMSSEPIFKIIFQNQANVYELHARELDIDSSYAFITVGDFVFGERSSILVDPSEEQLKNEFGGVNRTYIPMHAVIRIDEVTKSGKNKIVSSGQAGNVAAFPKPLKPGRSPEE